MEDAMNKQRRLSSALLASGFISTNGSYPRKKRTSDTKCVPNWNVGKGMEGEHVGGNALKVVLDFDRNPKPQSRPARFHPHSTRSTLPPVQSSG